MPETESGQDVYWTKQGANVIVENCVPDAQNALLDLGKWFKEKTGKMLVCTAGTNGSHAGGQYSHANGYKLDVNDWYGPEGLGGEYFGYPLDSNGTQLLADFVSYGHSLGLGMSIEGDHVDIQTTGYEWTTNTNYGGYGNPNGNNVQMHGGGGGSFAQTPYTGKGLDSARTHGFKDKIKSKEIGTVEITPQGKTYCEPVYPDYLYVTGNIPNSAVEQTVMSSKEGLKQVNGDTELMTAQAMQDLTGLDVNAFTTSDAQAFAQRLFDPKDSILEFKVPSAGKPLNNNDPYPVDHKIEELENHMPRVKQYKLDYYRECPVSKDIAKAILSLSDFTEKRLVKLENTLATVMRYVFGIGSRMFINCQYYGGQDHRAKGTGCCIRCLRDDRCADGQVMQLDQCLSCSRYEPIIGQTYDVLNEVGANLASIQDDVQMGYMNMEEYINWVRVEQMHNMKDDIELDYKNTQHRNKDEKDFKDLWDEGVRMNWKLTPVEQQKAQINWRQDINSADQSPSKLQSYQQGNGLGGSGLNPKSSIDKGSESKNIEKQPTSTKKKNSYSLMSKSEEGEPEIKVKIVRSEDGSKSISFYEPTDDEMELIYESATSKATKEIISDALDIMVSKGYEQSLQNACKKAGIDPCAAISLIILISGGDPTIDGGLFGLGGGSSSEQIKAGIEKLVEIKTQYGKDNSTVGWVQACKKWHENMDIVNKKGAIFDKDWVGVMSKSGFTMDDMDFYPAFVQIYKTVPTMKTADSQATSSNVNGVEFPFTTTQLLNIYYAKSYGATNYGAGVCTLVDGIVLQVKGEEEVHCPVSGTANIVDGDIRITDPYTGIQYIFSGVSGTQEGDVTVGSVMGTCKDKLIVRCLDSNGKSIDPKSQWEILGGKLSQDLSKSLGEYIEEEANKS